MDVQGKKDINDYVKDTVAFGKLHGVDDDGFIIDSYLIFQGNFHGAIIFEK